MMDLRPTRWRVPSCGCGRKPGAPDPMTISAPETFEFSVKPTLLTGAEAPTETEIAVITVSEGRRDSVDERVVALLQDSIQRRGLLSPIRIRPDGRLICGLQRLVAHERLGRDNIQAIVCEGDDVAVELDEIEENLARRDLTVLERATLELRRRDLYRELHPETRPGVAGARARYLQTKRPSFAAANAEPGSGKRMIEQRLQIAERLATLLPKLANKPVANNHTQLLNLARLPEAIRGEVAEVLTNGNAKTVQAAEAIARNGPKPKPPKRLPGAPLKEVEATLSSAANGFTAMVVLRNREVRIWISSDMARVRVMDCGVITSHEEVKADERPFTLKASSTLLGDVLDELPGDAAALVFASQMAIDDTCSCPTCGGTKFRRQDGETYSCVACEALKTPGQRPSSASTDDCLVDLHAPRFVQRVGIENRGGYGPPVWSFQMEWWDACALGRARYEGAVILVINALTGFQNIRREFVMHPHGTATTEQVKGCLRDLVQHGFRMALRLHSRGKRLYRDDGSVFDFQAKSAPPSIGEGDENGSL